MVNVDDLKLLEAIGVPEPPLWSGSITGQTAYIVRDVQEGEWKFKVNVGELFEHKVGGSDTQFAYITPTDVEATEYNAKVPPEEYGALRGAGPRTRIRAPRSVGGSGQR